MITSKYKTLVYNFSSLTILQISNFIFPLITFPYLVRVLGPEKYGLINFAAAFVMYFNIIIDYGFNITATKEVSINRSDNNKISKIVSSVIIIKLGLLVICSILFLLSIYIFSKFSDNYLVYFYSFIALFGTTLFPTWFFQGVEKMNYIAIINIFVKVFWVTAVFIFIRSEQDYLKLVLLNSFAQIFVGVISLVVVYFFIKIKFVIPTVSEIKKLLVDSWSIFISSAAISLYTTSNIFILGLFANNEIVGYFSAADKLRMAIQNLLSSVGQTIFPYLSNLFKTSYAESVYFIKKYLKLGSIFLLIITLSFFIAAEDIVLIVLGNKYEPSIIIFRVIIFLPLIIFYSNVFGIQILINLNYYKEFTKVVLLASFVSLILSFIFVPLYMETGLTIIMVITEMIVSICMFYFITKKNLLELNH